MTSLPKSGGTASAANVLPKREPSVMTAAGSMSDETSVGQGRQQLGSVEEVDAKSEAAETSPLEKLLSPRQLVLLFTVVWIFNFVLALSSGVSRVLTPYVTSSFSKHALTATTSVLSNIISGIIKLPYAKLLDVWGRPQCMAAMVVFATVGTVMMAACENVETYCAAQVLYSIGFFGIQFSFLILIADAVPLRQRGLLMGVISTPSILSIWACGPAAESVLDTIGFRWGFGVWAILIPVSAAPLLLLMFKYDGQARTTGLIAKPSHDRTLGESLVYYCKEFDVIGLVILSTGLCLLLLSISIYSYQPDGWRSPMIISFMVLGVLLIVSFLFYERYLAPTTFLPWALIADRTVVFTNLAAAILYTSHGLATAYIYSMLIVSFNQSVTNATYINNIEMVGASVANVLLGLALRYNGRIKYFALLLGIPLFILGEGLMIGFRIPETAVGLMVACQVLVSLGSGVMYPIEQLSLMAVSHTHTPALLAVEVTVVACGTGAGGAIATAIWTGMFREKLAEYLPAAELSKLDGIYGSLEMQSSYPVGSQARTAINRAYGESQRVIFITATSMLVMACISVLFWRDVDVRKTSPNENSRDPVGGPLAKRK